MDSSFQVEGGPVRLTLQQLLEEFICQRINRWNAKQKEIADRGLVAQMVAMCWDYDSLPREGPGCLMPDHKGGYVYIPYDESREGLTPDLQDRIDKLEHWFRNPANGPVVRQMDKILEREVNDQCFWEFLDGGNAARIDFHGKIKALARYRLMQTGVDVFPLNPRNKQFRFGIVDITEFGNVKMKWHHLSWTCTENQLVKSLEAYSNPLFSHQAVLKRLLGDLETIHHPEDAAKEAQALTAELQSQPADQNESDWLYFLCGPQDTTTALEERDWRRLRRQPNDMKLMKRESREESKWAIIIRPSLLRHYQCCNTVFDLQRRQMKYCQEVEPALRGPEVAGEPYFNGG